VNWAYRRSPARTNPDIKVILIEAEGDVFSMGGDINSFVTNKDRIHPHILDMATRSISASPACAAPPLR